MGGLDRRPDRRHDKLVVLIPVLRLFRLRGDRAEPEESAEGGLEPGRFLFRRHLRFAVFFRRFLAVLMDLRRGRGRSPDLAFGVARRVDAAGASGGHGLDFGGFFRDLGFRLLRIGAECDFQERKPVADEQENERGQQERQRHEDRADVADVTPDQSGVKRRGRLRSRQGRPGHAAGQRQRGLFHAPDAQVIRLRDELLRPHGEQHGRAEQDRRQRPPQRAAPRQAGDEPPDQHQEHDQQEGIRGKSERIEHRPGGVRAEKSDPVVINRRAADPAFQQGQVRSVVR